MSAIFGLFMRDGRPVDPEVIRAMRAAHDYWKPDATADRQVGAVALGHAMLLNTPWSCRERQPVEFAGTRVMLVADARLDNGEQLAGLLGLEAGELAHLGDADLLAMAWRRWGTDCPGRLLGDFVFAVWDATDQSLCLVRDHVGIRPLYYYLDDRVCAFASDRRALLAAPFVPRDLDYRAVAQYLQDGDFRSPERTLIQPVRKVPPASLLHIRQGGTSQRVFWRAEQAEPGGFTSLPACAEELRDLLRQAVAARVQSNYPVHAHLSGGLDSSAVASLAARCLAGSGKRLSAFNWVPAAEQDDDESEPEWTHARWVAKAENISLAQVPLRIRDIAVDLRETDIALGHNLELWYETPVHRALRDAGGRTLLSGWGGDELISNSGAECYADLFWHGRGLDALRLIVGEARLGRSSIKRISGLILRQVLAPALPDALKNRLLKPALGPRPVSDGLTPEFLAFMQQQAFETYGCPRTSNRAAQLYRFNHGHVQNRVESWASIAWKNRVEYSYPLLDKRVIEFSLGLPPEYFRAPGIGRQMFREACVGLLPDPVRLAANKSEPCRVDRLLDLEIQALAEVVARTRENCVLQTSAGAMGIVDVERLPSLLAKAQNISKSRLTDRVYAVEELLRLVRLLAMGRELAI